MRPDPPTHFELKVRPILVRTCLPCHGGKRVSGGLRVDSRAALLQGGDSGPAVVAGEPDKSLLIQAIRYSHERIHMPPENKRLSREAVADFVTWVKQGAVWPGPATVAPPTAVQRHWAFQPIQVNQPPADPTGWAEQPLDRFVRAKLHEKGLRPVGPTDRRALIRRATFDLIGLPPAPEDVAAFVADQSPDAFRTVVDRLLASPHYGERWGRHWMDVVHYADTAGDNADYPVPEARLYRDYIIDSFNADKPYDQFVREQLAGDVLARQGPREKYAEQVIATGFLALTRRYATAPYELWHLSLEDAIATTGAAFLGLTLRCARCHHHKFDPVTMEDYYGLYGVFASTTFPFAGAEEFASMAKHRQHFAPLVPSAEAAPRLKAYHEKVKELKTQLVELPKQRDQDARRLNQVKSELAVLERLGMPPDLPAAYAASEGKPIDVPMQLRGDPDSLGPVVKRGVPKFLAAAPPIPVPEGSSGRLQLAQWLTRPSHPLTARVMVNRIWQYHFGRGIVATPSNFGLRGEAPTHPELLDFLTDRFIKGGWSVKAMHRLVMLSKTYQLASVNDPANAAKDPDNRWHWRYDRRRLDAEAIRDALLAVSGNLDLRRPGPHPFPPIQQWGWTQHNPFKDVYPSNHRSVYLMTQRLQRHPYLGLFDGPDTNYSTDQRSSSTVPLQALYLMNNPFTREQGEGLARRLLAYSPDGRKRVERAVELAWGRPPASAEVEKAIAYIRQYQEELAKVGTPPERLELEAWTSYGRVILTANEFVYLD
jgi:hypothetical protein